MKRIPLVFLIALIPWCPARSQTPAAGPADKPAPSAGATVKAAPAPAWPSQGLAARYPGDVGLASDPRVIFTESFEQESIGALTRRWETVSQRETLSFASDAPTNSPGRQSLVME